MRRNLFAGESASAYLFAICGVSIISNLLGYLLVGRVGSFAGMSVASWVSYAVTQLIIVIVIVAFAAWRRYDVVAVSKLRPMTNPVRYALLVPIAVMTIVAFLPVSMLFQTLFEAMGVHASVSAAAISFDNVGIYFLALFVIALLPAVGEELLMRGTVLPGLATRGVWFGVFISALLFSLMHGNPVQTVYQFCIGAVLAVLFLLSGSIWPCVIVHFLNNFITLTISAYIPQVNAWIASLGNFNFLTGFVAFAVGVLVLFGLFYLYYRAGQPRRRDEGFKVVENGIVFEEYSVYAYSDETADKPKKKRGALFADTLRFCGQMFTPQGWRKAERALAQSCADDIPYLGKAQPMINVWLAVGLACVYWVFGLITLFV